MPNQRNNTQKLVDVICERISQESKVTNDFVRDVHLLLTRLPDDLNNEFLNMLKIELLRKCREYLDE